MALADAVLSAVLAGFLYLVPAGSIHLALNGLGNPRYERWEAPAEAADWKHRYRVGAWWGLQLNLLLFAFFLIEAVMFVVLAGASCAVNASHASAAAYRIATLADHAYTAVWVAGLLLALAGLLWSAAYFFRAKRAGWADPRRRDHLVLHLTVVPLGLLLAFVAFGILPRMVCPSLA